MSGDLLQGSWRQVFFQGRHPLVFIIPFFIKARFNLDILSMLQTRLNGEATVLIIYFIPCRSCLSNFNLERTIDCLQQMQEEILMVLCQTLSNVGILLVKLFQWAKVFVEKYMVFLLQWSQASNLNREWYGAELPRSCRLFSCRSGLILVLFEVQLCASSGQAL